MRKLLFISMALISPIAIAQIIHLPGVDNTATNAPEYRPDDQQKYKYSGQISEMCKQRFTPKVRKAFHKTAVSYQGKSIKDPEGTFFFDFNVKGLEPENYKYTDKIDKIENAVFKLTNKIRHDDQIHYFKTPMLAKAWLDKANQSQQIEAIGGVGGDPWRYSKRLIRLCDEIGLNLPVQGTNILSFMKSNFLTSLGFNKAMNIRAVALGFGISRYDDKITNVSIYVPCVQVNLLETITKEQARKAFRAGPWGDIDWDLYQLDYTKDKKTILRNTIVDSDNSKKVVPNVGLCIPTYLTTPPQDVLLQHNLLKK